MNSHLSNADSPIIVLYSHIIDCGKKQIAYRFRENEIQQNPEMFYEKILLPFLILANPVEVLKHPLSFKCMAHFRMPLETVNVLFRQRNSFSPADG
jgi:hypothetical protein